MHRAIAAVAIATCLVIAACATTQKGYVICNDLGANITCPDNTANVVVGM